MNETHEFFHCLKKAQRIYTEPYVERDLRWNYTSYNFGKPVDIHSKRQYDRLCKENNLVSMTPSEIRSIKPPKNDTKITNMTKRIIDKTHNSGIDIKHIPGMFKNRRKKI
jgi:hypothetical protein